MLDPARAAVDDGADPRQDAGVRDRPDARDVEGLERVGVPRSWTLAFLDELFPPRVAPAEDRIF